MVGNVFTKLNGMAPLKEKLKEMLADIHPEEREKGFQVVWET